MKFKQAPAEGFQTRPLHLNQDGLEHDAVTAFGDEPSLKGIVVVPEQVIREAIKVRVESGRWPEIRAVRL